MAVERNITAEDHWFTGEDKSLTDTITGTDISGWAISFLVKRKPTDADAAALLTKTTANGGIALTTPASGLLTISVADTDTDTVPPGTYYYEVKRTDPGFETVLTYGFCVLKRGVHRS